MRIYLHYIDDDLSLLSLPTNNQRKVLVLQMIACFRPGTDTFSASYLINELQLLLPAFLNVVSRCCKRYAIAHHTYPITYYAVDVVLVLLNQFEIRIRLYSVLISNVVKPD